MPIINRILAFRKEEDALNTEIHNFARKVAKYRGESVPGSHHYKWEYAPDGAYDYWNYNLILDPRPSIRTNWEYADCGISPYWFPTHWMDLSDEEWQKEADNDAELVRKAEEADELERVADNKRKQEARDQAEYQRLKEKYA